MYLVFTAGAGASSRAVHSHHRNLGLDRCLPIMRFRIFAVATPGAECAYEEPGEDIEKA